MIFESFELKKEDKKNTATNLQPSQKNGALLVGTARFELTTSRTPTNLRVNRKFSQSLKTNQNRQLACRL